ncbi:coiled-coil domain-containing protein [Candidatus Pacearchaeota archaeon]|jgi:hypothetical protein|nr:coiled-coil domain-containing protein [Candidatus Pacearchaeota archaeon]
MCVIITNSDIKQASLAALEEFFEEDDSECDNAEMILALMKDFDALRGCLEDQRDEIAGLKEKVKRLEERPYTMTDEAPRLHWFDHLVRPNQITYNTTAKL